MAKAPGVVLDRKSGQVRLRGLKWPLPVTLDTESKGRIKATIRPNTWTSVPEEIMSFLQERFETQRFSSVPDVEENEKNPHKPGEEPAMAQEEIDPGFFLEFRN